jgi:hypothetical protein
MLLLIIKGNSGFNIIDMSFFKRKKLDFILKGNTWIDVTIINSNVLYTFKKNNGLLVSTNGKGSNNIYEIMPDANSLTITKDDLIVHFEIVLSTNIFLVLTPQGGTESIVLVNNNKYSQLLKGKEEREQQLKVVCLNEAVSVYTSISK